MWCCGKISVDMNKQTEKKIVHIKIVIYILLEVGCEYYCFKLSLCLTLFLMMKNSSKLLSHLRVKYCRGITA